MTLDELHNRRAKLAACLKASRREALDLCMEIRALDHQIRAREPREGQSAPYRLDTTPSAPQAKSATSELDWG